MRIAAVIVTYNRLELLKICLNGVLSQSRVLDAVFLIDNGSSDGTKEWIEAEEISKNKRLIYVRLEENLGGAGGFAVGMRKAYEWGADYIWVMDDDVTPQIQCLEKLLEEIGDAGIVQPTRIASNGAIFNWHHLFDPVFLIKIRTNVESSGSEYLVSTNVSCFEGALIARKVIDYLGFPESKYFLGEDDTDFGYFASKKYYILYTSKARLNRLIPYSEKIPEWKLYYLVRNKIWFYKKLLTRELRGKHRVISIVMIVVSVLYMGLLNCRGGSSIKNYLRGIVDGIKGGVQTPLCEERRSQ